MNTATSEEKSEPVLTTLLYNGETVLAKRYAGQLSPKSYSNRAQAQKAAAKVGGYVIQRGQPFYVVPV